TDPWLRDFRCRGRRDGGCTGGKHPRRHGGGARYPEQRHAQLHQHARRGNRGPHHRVTTALPNPHSPIRNFGHLARPFTVVAPALGFMSGALTAVGAAPRAPWSPSLLVAPLVGSLMAAVLNAGNNALNQIYDLDIDRVNKPKRPLPSGRLTVPQVWWFTNVTYVAALILAWLVAPGGRHECFWLVLVAVICTCMYSVPPVRTKRLGIWANVTIAIPRGVLLKVAGWSSVKTIFGVEAWYIGAIFGL